MADYELAKAYVQIIPTTKDIGANLTGVMGSEGEKGGEAAGGGIAKGLKKALGTTGKVAAAGLMAATGTMVAFGKTAVSAGADFDSAMSQVMATMGFTAEDLGKSGSVAAQTMEKLRSFAQEQGATTAFSASQAAEALNYMALAGYDANKSMDMLPVVLDLAASGAMDLGSASDMVTDAQSALGLSTEETKTMVDQMAKTASSSNTSVSQLGEAFLKIGASARGVKGGTQELSTVLGVLADNGIKGSEGGTHLRNMLLSLQKPTDEGAKVLKELGIQVYDGEGKMRSMVDIIGEMQDATADMTDEQKTLAMSTLFNKTDLASVNALLGTSKERFVDLGGAIENASGSAKEMAKVQLDNLSGDVTLFKSALEGVQIAFSDKLTPEIRNFVQISTEGLGKIQEGLEQNGIAGAAGALGGLIGDLIQKFAEDLPKLVEAGGEMLTSIATGFINALPTMVSALPDLVSTGVGMVTDVIEAITKVLPELVTSLLTALPDIIKVILSAIPDITTAICNAIPEIITAVITMLPELFLQIGGAILEAFPKILGAVVEGLGGIISSVGTFFGELLGITTNHRKEIEEEVNKENEALRAFVDSMADIKPQLADYNSFVSESGETLGELNDKISEYEGKITETIQAALQEQGRLRAEDIQDIAEYTQKLLEAEEQKLTLYRAQQKAQLQKLMLETDEIDRETAEQHLANVSAALEAVNQLTDEEYTSRLTLIENKYAAMGQTGTQAYNEEMAAAKEWYDKSLAENQKYYDEAAAKLEENARTWVGTDAQKWDDLANNFERFVVDERRTYENRDGYIRTSMRAADVEFAEALKNMDETATNGLLAMAVSFKEGGKKMDEETETMVKNILNSFDGLPEELDEAGKNSLLGFIYGLEDEIPALSKASEMSSQEIVDTIKKYLQISSPSKVMQALGKYVTEGMANGISSSRETLGKAMQGVGSMISTSKSWGIANPATALTSMGKSMIAGLQTGVKDKQTSLVAATKTVGQQMATGVKSGFEARESSIKSSISSVLNRIVKSAKANLKIASPSKVFENIGEMIGAGMTVGIEESSLDAIEAAEDMATGISDVAKDVLQTDYSQAYDAANGSLQSSLVAAMGGGAAESGKMDDLLSIVRALYKRMESMKIVLDSGTLVGGIKNQMDDAIGENGAYTRRGMAV